MKLQTEKVPFFFAFWLVIAAVCTVACALAYATAQHAVRMAANQDPLRAIRQIQDIVKQGVDPSRIIPPSQTDIADNYSVFAAIFDSKGTAVSASFQVDGKNPSLPAGVFDKAKKNGEDRFTWQPKKTAREAVVVVPYTSQIQTGSSTVAGSGYIMAGQPLTETERTENEILQLAGAAWVISLAVTLLLCWAFFKDHAKHHAEKQIGETVV